jgi:hypothetical protein
MIGVLAASVLFVACADSQLQPGPTPTTSRLWATGQIQSVYAQSWPEGPLALAAGDIDGQSGKLSLSSILAFIPNPLPKPIPQSCTLGAMVIVTFTSGRTVQYGPCERPPSIENLRLEMMRLARSG